MGITIEYTQKYKKSKNIRMPLASSYYVLLVGLVIITVIVYNIISGINY